MIDFTQLNSAEACLDIVSEKIDPIVSRDGRTYPFVGVKKVKAVLEADPDLQIVNACLMYHLQSVAEQGAKETILKNHQGLMSSHAHRASGVIAGLIGGKEPDLEAEHKADGFRFVGDLAYLQHIGSRYSKQLSVALRSLAIAREPELAATAGMFSVR